MKYMGRTDSLIIQFYCAFIGSCLLLHMGLNFHSECAKRLQNSYRLL